MPIFSIVRPRRRTRSPLRVRLRTGRTRERLGAAVLLGGAVAVAAGARSVEQRERRLGPTVAVTVVVGDHAAGSTLEPGDVSVRRVPSDLAPAAAVGVARATDGRRLAVAVGDGEILVAGRFARAGRSRMAVLVPDGWRAIGIPRGPGTTPSGRGDRVDVLATGADGRSEVAAPEALVIDTGADAVTVAVPARHAGAVADAVLAGTVTLALRGD